MPLGEILEREDGDGVLVTIYTCSNCGYEHSYEIHAVDCCMFDCGWCGEMYESIEEADDCCPFMCEYCETHYGNEASANDCCYEQREQEEYERTYNNPDYPDTIREIQPTHTVFIPRMDERPMRLCSVEQELSRGGRAVAQMLYDTGLSEYREILNYSAEGRPSSIIVKSDGSLGDGGGEVVYGRFNLAHPDGYERMSQSLARIQQMRNEGIVDVGMDAGTHVHISAVDENNTPIGPAQMAGIYEIFSFGEDVIFRMGAAGWEHHRGTRYTQLVPKFNREQNPMTPGKIAKGSMQQRYFSLNFQRLLNAIHNCRCGAGVVGDWADCECDVLRTGTVEWRIFNGTTDPETIHAWLLLAHGITAASFTHQLHTLSAHEFERTDQMLHPWIFGWLLWNCPFEDEERQILFNVARQSPGLALPWENVDEFHEGWGQLAIPETPNRDAEFDNPQPDGSYPGCECATCTAARVNFAPEDEVVFDFNPQNTWQQFEPQQWRTYAQSWTQAQPTTYDVSDSLRQVFYPTNTPDVPDFEPFDEEV